MFCPAGALQDVIFLVEIEFSREDFTTFQVLVIELINRDSNGTVLFWKHKFAHLGLRP